MDEMDDTPAWEIAFEEDRDVLYIHYEGPFDLAAVQAAEVLMAKRVRKRGAQWKLISDFREATFVDPAVLDVIIQATQANTPFIRRSAVIDNHGAMRFITDAVTQRSGRTNVRICTTLEEALEWVWQDVT